MKSTLKCAEFFTKEQPWIVGGDDTEYLIKKYSNGEVVIAFLGSNSKVDWKANFSFFKKPYKDMDITFFVHGGFLARWKAVRDEIMDKVESLNPTSITVTGHSYGGAMALLCMEDCWFRFISSRNENSLKGKIHCITFGAPRVLGFYNYHKIRERWEGTVELWEGSDIVTCVPPSFFLYRHSVRRTHIGDKPRFLGLFRPAKYHPVEKYVESVEKINGEFNGN